MSLRYLLLTLVSAFCTPAAQAQTLNVQLSSGPGATVVGGYSQATLVSRFSITNTGNRPLTLGLARQVRQAVPGSENSFCFGAGCYPPPVSIAPQPITLAPNAVDNTFIGDYLPNGMAGITIIRYAIYDDNGSGTSADTVYTTITYDASQRVTGLAADLAASTLLSAPAPNPAVAGADITFTIAADAPRGSSLRLVDLRDGRTVSVAADGTSLIRCGTPPPVRTSSGCCGSFCGTNTGGCPMNGGGNGCGSGVLPGGCVVPGSAPMPVLAATTITVPTGGLAAGVYGCQLVDATGQPRAMRRLVIQ